MPVTQTEENRQHLVKIIEPHTSSVLTNDKHFPWTDGAAINGTGASLSKKPVTT